MRCRIAEASIANPLLGTRLRWVEYADQRRRKVNVRGRLLLNILDDLSLPTGDDRLQLVVDIAYFRVQSVLFDQLAAERSQKTLTYKLIDQHQYSDFRQMHTLRRPLENDLARFFPTQTEPFCRGHLGGRGL